jgi:RNA polymerase sigma-70 factor (ECF subfamily)
VERPDTSVLPNVASDTTRDFDALFKAYYRRLARVLFRVTGDTTRAEEVAAEAFWRLYERPPASNSNLEGWLYRTGVRLALDVLKKDRRRTRYESLAALFGTIPTPHEVLAQQEEQARVRATLAALKPDQTTLIVLRSDGLTYAEVAAALDLNPTSVGTALSRAEAAFRKEYVRRHGEFSKQ